MYIGMVFFQQMFASGLNSLFELLEVNEDCYGMGYLSKLIATELANMPSARVRRKVQSPEQYKFYNRQSTILNRTWNH